MAEAVLVEFYSKPATEVYNRFGYLHSHGKYDQVEFFFNYFGVPFERRRIAHLEFVGQRVFFDVAQTAAGVLNAVFLFSPAVIFLVTFAVGARVHEKNLAEYVAVSLAITRFGLGVFEGHDGFFGGVHTAHRRAVIVTLVPAAHTL